MELSKEAIEEYKRIYKAEFGEEISDQEAYKQAINLLQLFKIIYRPISEKKEYKNPQIDP